MGHATGTPSLTSIEYVTFQIANATLTGEGIEVSNTGLIVSYIDANNSVNLTWQSSPPTTTPGWGFEFLTGNGPLLQPGERVEITVNLSGLTTPLGTGQEFTIEVKPSLGAVLAISKKTPGEFTTVVSLD